MARRRIKGKLGARKPHIHPVHNSRINFLEILDEDEQRQALDTFVRAFKTSRDWLSDRREKWSEYYQLYRSYSPYYENRPTWQSSFFIPKIFEAVETIHPRMLSALFAVPPLWTANPAKPDMEEAARQWEYFLDTRQRQMGMYLSMYEITKELLIYGTAWAKVFYQADDFYEGSMVMPGDVFDIFPDPMASRVESKFRTRSMRYIIQRDVTHIDYLRELAAQKLYDKKKVDSIKRDGGYAYFSPQDRMQSVGIGGSTNDLAAGDLTKDIHEVQEYWGRYTLLSDDGEEPEVFNVVATYVDRNTLVRFEENPYVMPLAGQDYWYAVKPYVMFRDVVLPNEAYGVGEPEILRYLQLELNDRRNQIGDAIQLAISPVYQFQTGTLVDSDIITFTPGSMIETRVPDALRPLQRDFGFMQGYQETEMIKQEMQDATGGNDPIAGRPLQKNVKATEYLSLIEQGGARIGAKIALLDQVSLPELGRMIYLLEKQYTREDVFAQIMDDGIVKKFMSINPSQLKFEGDFNIQVASLYGQKGAIAQRRAEITQLALSLVQAGVIPPNAVDFIKLLKSIAAASDIRETNIFNNVPPVQPPQPEAAQPSLALPSNVVEMSKRRSLQPTSEIEEMLAQQAGLAQPAGATGGGEADVAALEEMLASQLRGGA